MSRSGERRGPHRVVAIGLAGLAGLGLAVSGGSLGAAAPSATPSVKSVWAPTPMPAPVQKPVEEIQGGEPIDILAVTEDTEGTAQVAEGPRTTDVTLNSNVLFAKDSDVIRPEAKARLNEVTAQLKQQGPGRLAIVGYTDDLGSSEHGLDLSRRRAAAVRAIVEPGLPGVTITTEGRGEADPVNRPIDRSDFGRTRTRAAAPR